jgi:hypothetical protein
LHSYSKPSAKKIARPQIAEKPFRHWSRRFLKNIQLYAVT